jgi:hypothetical protein
MLCIYHRMQELSTKEVGCSVTATWARDYRQDCWQHGVSSVPWRYPLGQQCDLISTADQKKKACLSAETWMHGLATLNHISSYGFTLFFQNMQTGLVSSLVCNHKLAKAGTDDPRLSEILGNTVTDKVCSSTSHSSKCSKLTPQAQHTASHIMRTARLSAPDHDSREPRGLQHVHFNSIP